MKNYDTFTELACARFSVRKFSDRPVEKEKLGRILSAAQAAPSAKNCQPWSVIVLESEKAVETVRSVTKFAFNAPTVLLICCDASQAWVSVDGLNSAHIDSAIAATHMMLAAWDEGIGSCWVRDFDKYKMIEAFNLPESAEPVALMPIGYAAEGAKPAKGWHDKRKTLDELVKYL